MAFSQLFFGHTLDTLTYDVIEDYFLDTQDESDKIEFKSYASQEERNHGEKENGVLRAVCALLNSSGGVVIWGAPEGKRVAGRQEKVFQGTLSPLTQRVEKDKFMNRMADLITPSPSGIRMKELEKDGSFIYVYEVEPSRYAPHQFKNIYYMRIDGQSRPAPHPYIEAMFRKVSFPRLEGYINVLGINNEDPKQIILKIDTFIFNWSKLQNEHNIYFRLITSVGKFRDHYGVTFNGMELRADGSEIATHNAKPTLYYNEPIVREERIYFQQGDLIDADYKVEILFYFAGKSSPLCVSEYTLDLSKSQWPDPNRLIVEKVENQFVHESGDQELSDRQKLNDILGRSSASDVLVDGSGS